MYKEWSEGQIAKMKGILNTARDNHTAAVKSRIENVKQMGSVVDVTKQLFEVSKVGSYPTQTRIWGRKKLTTMTRKLLLSKLRRSN